MLLIEQFDQLPPGLRFQHRNQSQPWHFSGAKEMSSYAKQVIPAKSTK